MIIPIAIIAGVSLIGIFLWVARRRTDISKQPQLETLVPPASENAAGPDVVVPTPTEPEPLPDIADKADRTGMTETLLQSETPEIQVSKTAGVIELAGQEVSNPLNLAEVPAAAPVLAERTMQKEVAAPVVENGVSTQIESEADLDSASRTCEIQIPNIQAPAEAKNLAAPDTPHEEIAAAKLPEEIALVETLPTPENQVSNGSNSQSEITVAPQPEEGSQAEEASSNDTVTHRYQPPRQRSPRQPAPRPQKRENESPPSNEIQMEIRVRLTFNRFNSCKISLLPQRTPELDDEIVVKSRGTSFGLFAQEDWYQDLSLEELSADLRQGVELKGTLKNNRRVRWLLTGRDLCVLAQNQRASGFVSTNRLSLGRTHVVLCLAELLPQVEEILIQAGCQQYTQMEQASGVPPGWIGLRNVCPSAAIPLNEGLDAFYAIKPAPDIEIELEGGVCLRNSVWLAGYPPRIKLLGQSLNAIKVLIDGKEAGRTPDGYFIADGHDLSGQSHLVACEGLTCSRSYLIEEPPDTWELWAAYEFAEARMCGPLVNLIPEAAVRRSVTVPMSNPLLIGARPGEIFHCTRRNVTEWKGFVPFDVVWALPSEPLHCDKRSARILQFADAPIVVPSKHSKAALKWCNVVLDASRKGLQIDGNSPSAKVRWHEYKKAARKIWRAA